MNFSQLQTRLTHFLRLRVQSGEWTERGLARLTGVSQPHIHNVLKGSRILSPEISDQIMKKLDVCLLDLLREDEIISVYNKTQVQICVSEFLRVPLLEGRAGPGYPFPASFSQRPFLFPAEGVETIERPAAVRLAGDPRMAQTYSDGDTALVCLRPPRPAGIGEASLWILEEQGQSRLRRLRREAGLVVLTSDLGGEEIRRVGEAMNSLRAEVKWIVRETSRHSDRGTQSSRAGKAAEA